MTLSVYINKQWISAVLCQDNPIQILEKVFIERPYSTDNFSTISMHDLFELLAKEMKKDLKELMDTTKILVVDDLDNDFSTDTQKLFDHILSFDQVSNAVGMRFISTSLFDDTTQALAVDILDDLLNQYKTLETYHAKLPDKIAKSLISAKIADYLNKRQDDKNNLYEIIISSTMLGSRKDELEFGKMIMSILKTESKQTNIYELTYDFGCFMLVIIAMLIAKKANIKKFFEENPVQIDAKIVTIPDLKDNFDLYINDEKKTLEDYKTKEKSSYYIAAGEKDIVKISATDPAKKINITTNGVIDGIYLNTK